MVKLLLMVCVLATLLVVGLKLVSAGSKIADKYNNRVETVTEL